MGNVVVFACSVRQVEQELWQREDKGLIGVLPVRDSEAVALGSILSSGEIDCFS
jgi:ATP-dependent Lon protease